MYRWMCARMYPFICTKAVHMCVFATNLIHFLTSCVYFCICVCVSSFFPSLT